MDTRRDFLKKTVLLSGGLGWSGAVPASIRNAFAIDPAPGSTYLDAEHVVILMQENRSFDHCFGTLNGVRGYNDRNVIRLPDNNKVWLQRSKAGGTYAPFHFDIKNTNATWLGDTPHSRSSQVDAFNNGHHDNWIDSKRVGNPKYRDIPLTMGYYTRGDVPFHYAMADAFTICDQHFSSAMTSTWPNRLYMWGGTIREEKNDASKAFVRNAIAWGEARWKTFPELLEDHGISWKIYQNDLCSGGGYEGEERAWLTNFICNLMEWLSQYQVKFSDRYIRSLHTRAASLAKEIAGLKETIGSSPAGSDKVKKAQSDLARKTGVLAGTEEEMKTWSKENFEKLSPYQKNLFYRAFSTNAGDPDFRKLTALRYKENGVEREVAVPKGDIFYQFRKDVDSGNLPAVSWHVAPQNFSDHPSAPWYGSWYTSEILDILTRNPEVWKKTIFILTYDENDGYFDHIPPFIPPDPRDADTGKCSGSIRDTGAEYIRLERELEEGIHEKEARGGAIGLGYRVPMIVASPWSRGGKVCSQVFDHTSSIQFLEAFLSKKLHKEIRQEEITSWRRAVCGDLTSVFSPFDRKEKDKIDFLKKEPWVKKIYQAKFQQEPANYKKLSPAEIGAINRDPAGSGLMPHQEEGIRPACPLPYQLYAGGALNAQKTGFRLALRAADEIFGKRAAGAPFKIYSPGATPPRDYTVAAGESLTEEWPLNGFEKERYHVCLYGPNGFFREFTGDKDDPPIKINCEYEYTRSLKKKLTGNIVLKIKNTGASDILRILVTDNAYKGADVSRNIDAGGEAVLLLDLKKSHRWYDFTITAEGNKRFAQHYAGKVETGRKGYTDPAMA